MFFSCKTSVSVTLKSVSVVLRVVEQQWMLQERRQWCMNVMMVRGVLADSNITRDS